MKEELTWTGCSTVVQGARRWGKAAADALDEGGLDLALLRALIVRVDLGSCERAVERWWPWSRRATSRHAGEAWVESARLVEDEGALRL